MSKLNTEQISLLKAAGLEKEFLDKLNIDSLDDLHRREIRDVDAESVKPKLTASPSVSAAPVEPPELKKEVADAPPPRQETQASDILTPYIGNTIIYASRKKLSGYWPSSRFMFYMLHHANSVLVDNYYFKRYCPDYHPYVLRLYYGIIFYIQCIRSAAELASLTSDQHQFLVRFLSAHSLESLTIIGPLVPLFKTLCSSQPEILNYGKIYPRIPGIVGPTLRSSIRLDNHITMVLPDIPGIFALLDHLNDLFTAEPPVYPAKGRHTPVKDRATTFGFHAYPIAADRSDFEKWSLSTPGLEYPCEADKKLNESFAERYENFDFPDLAADDDLRSLAAFLSMESTMSWFSQVKEVAASAATYFQGSGTLADCSPSGIQSNQILVRYSNPAVPPTAPRHTADRLSLFPFSITLKTTARNVPALAVAMAAQAQTNIRMFPQHPYYAAFGSSQYRIGDFWDIRPIESSSEDEQSYLAMFSIIKKMMLARV